MAKLQQAVDERLRAAQLVADATCALLRVASVPELELPGVMQTFREIATGIAPIQPVPVAAVLPAVIAAARAADLARMAPAEARQPARARPRRWKPVAATITPPTPVQRLAAALRRSPIRLNDRCAMAIARASGKAIGRDMLEQAVQVDDLVTLTFGFKFGSAKFVAEFDVGAAAGGAALSALMEMLDAPA